MAIRHILFTNSNMHSIIAIDTNSFKANLLRYASLLVFLMCIGIVQAQVPGAPTNLVVTGINTGGLIQFTASASVGGSAITNYEYSIDNGANWITPYPAITTSPLIISSGLINYTSYQVKIRAVNAAGTSAASIAATLVPSNFNFGVNWTDRTSAWIMAGVLLPMVMVYLLLLYKMVQITE
jgi:hypothetical protein